MLPRGIADHAPMLMCLRTQTPPAERLWRLSRHWISEGEVEGEISDCISEYWMTSAESTTVPLRWDAFKAYVRRCYLTAIAQA